jgi:hypothetical protein
MMKNDEPPSLDKYLQSFQVADKLEVLIIEWRPTQGSPLQHIEITAAKDRTLLTDQIHNNCLFIPLCGIME